MWLPKLLLLSSDRECLPATFANRYFAAPLGKGLSRSLIPDAESIQRVPRGEESGLGTGRGSESQGNLVGNIHPRGPYNAPVFPCGERRTSVVLDVCCSPLKGKAR